MWCSCETLEAASIQRSMSSLVLILLLPPFCLSPAFHSGLCPSSFSELLKLCLCSALDPAPDLDALGLCGPVHCAPRWWLSPLTTSRCALPFSSGPLGWYPHLQGTVTVVTSSMCHFCCPLAIGSRLIILRGKKETYKVK